MLGYIYNLATDKYQGFVPTLLKILLYIFSLFYGLVIRCLIIFYQLNPYKAKVKVISIGNITLGGTGKTPLVEYIARKIISKSKKVAIVTRGYKSKDGSSDEVAMLKENLVGIPIVVNPDRVAGIKKAAVDFNPEAVILDDAFQQWRIKKDLEILIINALNPFGNKNMIPRGVLREPLSSLKRADIFIITKADPNNNRQELVGYLNKANPRAEIYEQHYFPVGYRLLDKASGLLSKDLLRGRKVVLVSAIGDPGSFRESAKVLDLEVSLTFEFPDHYFYSLDDLNKIIVQAKSNNIDTIVTTQKDAVKLRELELPIGVDIFVLCIEPKFIKDEERFASRLFRVFNS